MTLSWTFSFFSSRPGKVRSKVVPLKGSIKEPNLPFKSCDDLFFTRAEYYLGFRRYQLHVKISSLIHLLDVSKQQHHKFHHNLTFDFVYPSWAPFISLLSPLWFSHLCPLWFWGEDETSLSCSFTPVKLKYFPPWKSYFFPFSDYKIADLRPNWGGSLTTGATVLLPSFKGFSSLNKGLSRQRLNWL